MQRKSDAKGLGEFDNNVFFADNLVPVERFINQMIAFSDDSELELIEMLVDPITGSVLYVIVSRGGWFGIGGDRHVIPFQALQLESDSRQLTIDNSGITLNENTIFDPEREGRWGSEEIVSYCKNTGLKNIMEESRQQEMARRQRESEDAFQIHENLECLVEISRLFNRDVHGQNNEVLGEMQTFLLDAANARIKLAVMESGSLLGDDGGDYLIPWEAMQLDPLGKTIRLLVNENKLDKFSKAGEFGWDGSHLPKDRAKEVYSLYEYDYTPRQ